MLPEPETSRNTGLTLTFASISIMESKFDTFVSVSKCFVPKGTEQQ